MRLTIWRGLTATRGQRVELDGAALIRRFLSPRYSGPKDLAPGWSPAIFRDDQRGRDHVERVTALVLDYDHGPRIEDVRWHWQRYRGVLHTTARHTAEAHRCRVVLMLSREVTASEHEHLYSWAIADAASAGHELDRATRDPSRFWYAPIASASYRAMVLGGTVLAPDPLVALSAISSRTDPARPAGRHHNAGLDKIRGEIASAANGERNRALYEGALKLASRAKRGEISESEARTLAHDAARSAGLEEREIGRTITSAWRAARG